MRIQIPIHSHYSLLFSDESDCESIFPTSRLQKGLLLFNKNICLSGEAVGFGMPVIKRGLQTIFPGSALTTVDHSGELWRIKIDYQLNLVEKIRRQGRKNIETKWLYSIKNLLAGAIRRTPLFRKLLSGFSIFLRRVFKLETGYAQSSLLGEISVSHWIKENSGTVRVEENVNRLPEGTTEIVVMNEQSAAYFKTYGDSSGIVLFKDKVGCWDRVKAEHAWFESTFPKVRFTLNELNRTTLYRGFEMMDDRLAWAGFGYSFAPSIKRLAYELKVEAEA